MDAAGATEGAAVFAAEAAPPPRHGGAGTLSLGLVQLSGDVVASVSLPAGADVSELHAAAAVAVGGRCRLLHGEALLGAGQSLAAAGLQDGAEVVVIRDTAFGHFDGEACRGVMLSGNGKVAALSKDTTLCWVSAVTDAVEGPSCLSVRVGGFARNGSTDYFVGFVPDARYQAFGDEIRAPFNAVGVSLCLAAQSDYSGELGGGTGPARDAARPFGARKFAPGDVISVEAGTEAAEGGLRFAVNGEWSAPMPVFAPLVAAGPYRLGGNMYSRVEDRSLTIVDERP